MPARRQRDAWWSNPDARQWRCPPPSADVLPFHSGFPGYAPTALIETPSLARELGVGRVFVKDESSRFELPAFKVLGVSWAVYRALSERAGGLIEPAQVDRIRERVAALLPLELVTATDGNHGRAVARMARPVRPDRAHPRSRQPAAGHYCCNRGRRGAGHGGGRNLRRHGAARCPHRR